MERTWKRLPFVTARVFHIRARRSSMSLPNWQLESRFVTRSIKYRFPEVPVAVPHRKSCCGDVTSPRSRISNNQRRLR
jgi:hypothetical protein